MTTVREVMTPGVETVTPSQPLREAARLMRTGDFGSVPVVDNGRLVGMVTDRDIVVRAVAEGLDTEQTHVEQVASGDPVMVAADQDLKDAIELMELHQVRRLPVVEEGRLVGLLSQEDVALEAKEKQTGELLHEISQPSSTPRETM